MWIRFTTVSYTHLDVYKRQNLATGAALANKKVLKNDKVSVVFFGDGASNRGTFHEAMNVASAWKLPVIFVNEMNCWASTTPYRTTCNTENISDRAVGYHVPGVIVDGQDVFAVYDAAVEAVERARNGEGPTFIEAKTYRIEGHYVGDPEPVSYTHLDVYKRQGFA